MKRLFFTADHDEVDDDVVCVGYETEDYPAALQMFDRCYEGAGLLLQEGQEMAFYLSRHCAESVSRLLRTGLKASG